MKSMHRITLLAAAAMQIAACASGDNAGNAHAQATSVASAARTTGADKSVYRDASWRFSIDVPPGWALHHDFTASYLANGAWKTFATPGSQGTPVIALTVPGSNRVTDAEIRIGVGKTTSQVQHCATPPATVRPGSLAHEAIGGVEFTTFTASDAAMSHYLDVRSYRAVHDGACYAIDLLVYGVNPQVFDPPATPPFSREQAVARMRPVLESFRFTR